MTNLNQKFDLFKAGCLILVLIFANNYVEAQERIKSIKDKGVLTIGLTGKQPPFSLESKNGSLMGYEIDLSTYLANAMGVRLRFVEMPFPELLPSLEAAKVDLIMSGITMTTARNMNVAFVGPYISTGKSLLTKSEKYASISSYEELNSKKIRIVALRGSTSEEFVLEKIPDASLELVDEYDEAIERVKNNEVDIMLADYAQCIFASLKYTEDNLLVLNSTFTNERIGIALPPDDALLINLVENFLGELRESGELDQLENKWFRSGSWLLQAK